MESEGSVPCSQDPSTGPYVEPDESGPYRPKDELCRSENGPTQHGTSDSKQMYISFAALSHTSVYVCNAESVTFMTLSETLTWNH
jgi:hypothetical protein